MDGLELLVIAKTIRARVVAVEKSRRTERDVFSDFERTAELAANMLADMPHLTNSERERVLQMVAA